MEPKEPQAVSAAPPLSLWRVALLQASTFGRALLAALLKRWPWVAYTAFLWGISKVCDLAAEPWQSACELLVKLGRMVTP